jgi:hypothetical protein
MEFALYTSLPYLKICKELRHDCQRKAKVARGDAIRD